LFLNAGHLFFLARVLKKKFFTRAEGKSGFLSGKNTARSGEGFLDAFFREHLRIIGVLSKKTEKVRVVEG